MATKLTDPNTGSTVSVDDSQVDRLVNEFGYTRQSSSKSSSSKTGSTSKSSSK